MIVVISVDREKQQVGYSIKKLRPDPFEEISNYELNKEYLVKGTLMDFGIFVELQPGLTCLLHATEMGWTKKILPQKNVQNRDEIPMVADIDREKRKFRLTPINKRKSVYIAE